MALHVLHRDACVVGARCVGLQADGGDQVTGFEAEMQRMLDLDMAVRNYLSHLYAFEQGAVHDEVPMMYWREQLEVLTSGEVFETEDR
jgi:hypothetical protein